jgi:murein DD-endopeptidase MepM/ murein hydrolase activator NlpD
MHAIRRKDVASTPSTIGPNASEGAQVRTTSPKTPSEPDLPPQNSKGPRKQRFRRIMTATAATLSAAAVLFGASGLSGNGAERATSMGVHAGKTPVTMVQKSEVKDEAKIAAAVSATQTEAKAPVAHAAHAKPKVEKPKAQAAHKKKIRVSIKHPLLPVGGKRYNIGYDAHWNNFNSRTALHNSDFYLGAGDANHSGGHHGVDIFAPEGTKLQAPVSGKVVDTGYGSISGNYVQMVSGNREFFFAHMDSIAPGIHGGKHVKAGQKLGRLGDTGQAQGTAPHLHFEMEINGVDQDPFKFLKKGHQQRQAALHHRSHA